MPELPEVETIVRQLGPRLAGQTLLHPKLSHAHVLRGVTPRRLLRTLRSHPIAEVSRRAKHIVVRLGGGRRMIIQLRMTGALMVHDEPIGPDDRRYAVLKAGLADGGTLVFRDVRRLGTIALLDEAEWRTYTKALGPEPLGPGFTREAFIARLRPARTAIKKALMDQRRVVGVGNIYANEALFRAGIDPSRGADRLTDDDYRRLYRTTRHVLRQAIRAGGTTFRDYRNGEGGRGRYQRTLLVYGREGEPCARCGTRLATTHGIDGRATVFCWRCQGKLTVGSPSGSCPRPSGPSTRRTGV